MDRQRFPPRLQRLGQARGRAPTRARSGSAACPRLARRPGCRGCHGGLGIHGGTLHVESALCSGTNTTSQSHYPKPGALSLPKPPIRPRPHESARLGTTPWTSWRSWSPQEKVRLMMLPRLMLKRILFALAVPLLIAGCSSGGAAAPDARPSAPATTLAPTPTESTSATPDCPNPHGGTCLRPAEVR